MNGYRFGATSLARLETCDQRWLPVMHDAIRYMDISVLCGHRGKADQNKAYQDGKSKLIWPNSKHNRMPSLAIDVAPWDKDLRGIDWDNRPRFAYMAGLIIGIGAGHGLTIRWGGDWDMDGEMRDHSFHDLPHFEITEGRI